MPSFPFTQQQIDAVFALGTEEEQRLVHQTLTHLYYTFQPRPDCVEDHDQQSDFLRTNYRFNRNARYGKGQFIYEDDERFWVLLGGRGSGKTVAAAHKTARHVLENPPPRPLCPFWIVGETYDTTCKVCWAEKLSEIIPESEILTIPRWHNRNLKLPLSVILRHPRSRNSPGWVLEFKSYEQGIEIMKGQSIGGYWFNEEVPLPVVDEVQARCRDYDSPGWADFTPITVKSPEWPDRYREPPDGWRFLHLNSYKNTTLAEGFHDRLMAATPEDMRETKTIGTFTVLTGTVYKEFAKQIHVIPPFIPQTDWRKMRGLDFGFNNPFCCLWGCKDHDGRYYIYDEHYESQRLNEYHAMCINGDTGKAEHRHRGLWKHPPNSYYGNTYSDHDAQQRAELEKLGIACTPAAKDINNGIEFVRSMMMIQDDGHPMFFVTSNCVNLIREIRHYKWPDGTKTRNPNDVPIDKDNHALDSMRYLIFTDASGYGRTAIEARQVRKDMKRHGILFNRGSGGMKVNR